EWAAHCRGSRHELVLLRDYTRAEPRSVSLKGGICMRTNLMCSLALAVVFAAACQTETSDTSADMTSTAAPTAASAHITAAVADAARPQADKDLDAARKPAEMMAFAEVQAGDKVGELIPGGGYMTRVLSKSVGPTGKVYLFNGPPRQA